MPPASSMFDAGPDDARLDRVGQDLLEQGDQGNEGPGRLGLMAGEQLVGELRHDRGRVVLGGPALRCRQAHAVVLDDEAVQPVERRRLLGPSSSRRSAVDRMASSKRASSSSCLPAKYW